MFLVILVGLPAWSSAGQTTLLLKSPQSIRLTGATANIGDVFTVYADNAKYAQSISDLPLVEFRLPGEKYTLQKYQVESVLRRQHLYQDVHIRGEFPVLLGTSVKQVTPEEWRNKINAYFSRMERDGGLELEWKFIQRPSLEIFAGEPLSMNFTYPGELKPGRLALRCEIRNGTYHRWMTLMLDLNVQRQVCIVTRDIHRGESLDGSNTRLELRSLDRNTSRFAVKALDDGQQLVARQNIHNGKILLTTDVKKQDIVHSGDNVQLLVQQGSVRIESVGRAMDSGGIHDEIRVRDHLSGKIVTGIIIGENTIQIEPMRNL